MVVVALVVTAAGVIYVSVSPARLKYLREETMFDPFPLRPYVD